MRYLPHTAEDVDEMLKVVGVKTVEDLFSGVPVDCRWKGGLELPPVLSEWDLSAQVESLAAQMASSDRVSAFIGAGSYDHYVPAALTALAGRSEFLTSYTPYQPEMNQGTLQAIYEYQTLVARLLGMEIATASHYDGATALAESLLMSVRLTRRRKVAVSRLVHPLYRQVLHTYLGPAGVEVLELPINPLGTTDRSGLEEAEDLAGVAVQSPNFFGCVENLGEFACLAHAQGALLVACFTEPLAYGLLKNPGSQGADIVCGEGQSLGNAQGFGGPGLGIIACGQKYVRSLPGRLVGKARDVRGRDGFVLTLATREQHIRREKATSNICTNHSLCALTAAIYLALLGGTGFRRLAKLNYDKTIYLKRGLREAGLRIPFAAPTFNEFVVEFPDALESVTRRLQGRNIVAGLPLAGWYPEWPNAALLCVTETKSRFELDRLIREVKT